MTAWDVARWRVSSVIWKLIELGAILFGKKAITDLVVGIRLAWSTYQDKEFVSACDEQYNSMIANQSDYEKDRENSWD